MQLGDAGAERHEAVDRRCRDAPRQHLVHDLRALGVRDDHHRRACRRAARAGRGRARTRATIARATPGRRRARSCRRRSSRRASAAASRATAARRRERRMPRPRRRSPARLRATRATRSARATARRDPAPTSQTASGCCRSTPRGPARSGPARRARAGPARRSAQGRRARTLTAVRIAARTRCAGTRSIRGDGALLDECRLRPG